MNVRDYYQFIRITNFSAVKTYLSLGLEKRFRVFPFAPVEWFGKWGSLVWDWYCQVFVGEQLAVQEHLSRSGAREAVSLVPAWDSGLFPGLSPRRMLLRVLAVGEVSAEPGRPEGRAGARGTGAEDR